MRIPWEPVTWFNSALHKGKGGSAPAAPDPVATARAQGAMNRETAITQAGLNMTNQVTPQGTLTYRQIGKWEDGTPQFEATTALSPEQQALYDSGNRISQTALDTGQTLFNNVQAQVGQAPPQFDDDYRRQQMAAILSRTQGARDRQRAQLETQLANQGIGIGSEAYRAAMDDLGRSENDFLLGADLQAGNEARNAYSAALAGRNQPINELSALLGLGQVQNPQFQQTPQTGVAPTDYLGAVRMGYEGQMNQYNQSQANRRALWGAIGSLGGQALGGWARGGFGG